MSDYCFVINGICPYDHKDCEQCEILEEEQEHDE